MKLLILVSALALVACGTTQQSADTPIVNQKLSTSFVSEKIKIETACGWFWNSSKCEVVAIESVGTATTNGNTGNNRKTALIRAGDRARANVRHFIQEDISSSRVTTTIAKNVEKANDRFEKKVNSSEEVSVSDQEGSAGTVRQNSNDTAYQLTETIRVNAQGILRGFRVIKEEVVGPQEVAVTIRWDKESEMTSDTLRKKFGN